MSPSLQGKIAIVTGAAQGIGRAIAERLANDGAHLVLGDADGDALSATAQALGAGGKVAYEVGDLSNEDVAGRLIQRAVDSHQRIDVLVNNAGGGIIKPFLEQTPETLRTTIDRNLWTALWCCWQALPIMRQQRYGRIINIGADSVRNGLWDHAAYNAAKGGYAWPHHRAGARICRRWGHCQHRRAMRREHTADGSDYRDPSGPGGKIYLGDPRGASRRDGGSRLHGQLPGIGRGSVCDRPGHQRQRRCHNVMRYAARMARHD